MCVAHRELRAERDAYRKALEQIAAGHQIAAEIAEGVMEEFAEHGNAQ